MEIKSPVNGATIAAGAKQLLVAAPRGSRLKCRVNKGRRKACKRATVLRNLRDGVNRVTVTAVTRNGDSAVTATRFRVDTRPPVVTITSPKPGQTFGEVATATFTANEPATFTCRVDSGDDDRCVTPATSDEIPDGRHTLTVTARDAAGNVGSARVTFNVDRAPDPEPTDPQPTEPAPNDPAPTEPTPTDPTSPPVDPTPTDPTPTDPAPTDPPPAEPTPNPTATANATDSSHIRLTWQSPTGAATVEIVRRDLVDTTPDVVVATVPAATATLTDGQLWFANSYRYTLNFKDSQGANAGTLTASATTNPVTSATFPVPFKNSPDIGGRITAQTAMAPATTSSRYRDYVVAHTRNANLTLRSYGVPVYEAKPTDRLIGPFNCGYNCQLPRSGAASVPLPTKPKPVGVLGLGLMADPGTDHHMSIVSHDGNTIWDLFRPDEDNTDVDRTNPATWQFAQAGAAFAPNATTPAIAAPANYAAANAANFANLAGLIRPEELALGEIRHALMMSVPGIGTAGDSGTNLPACPATHNALVKDPLTGANNPDAPPEGLRFRLNPAFNVATLTRPWERTIAKAMQEYGVYVRDNGGTISVYAENTKLDAVTGDTRGGRGYDGWNKAKLGLTTTGNSAGFSSSFPWNQLEVVDFRAGPSCG